MTSDDAVADLVRLICERVADRPGDPAPLVGDEVRRMAPLRPPDEQQRIVTRVLAHLHGLGELDGYVHDDTVDEVLVNAGREIWIDRNGCLRRVGTLDDVDLLIERALAPLGRRVDRTSPIVDARLPDGARLCAVLPPIAVDGPTISIRRFRQRTLPLDAFTDAIGASLLRSLVADRCNIVVSGATSSGKTSLVATLLGEVSHSHRLILVEDTSELPLRHPHAVRLEARPSSLDGPAAIDLAQLVRTALRLRPDRIVVGEVRGDEVLALVQAMNTGHDGSISTCHANGPFDAVLRLESLVLQAAPAWPLAAIRHQIARSIDVVVHVSRRSDGSRRVVEIGELVAPSAVPDGDSRIRTIAELGPDDATRIVASRTRSRR
jgi:pilus assembly protein CpaF